MGCIHNKVTSKSLPISLQLPMEQRKSASFVSLGNKGVHLQNNTFILRKVVENLCDMAYQKYCKIFVSQEVCLYDMTYLLRCDD